MLIELQRPKSRAKIILFDNESLDKPRNGFLILKRSQFDVSLLSHKKIIIFEDLTFEKDIENLIQNIKSSIPKKEIKKTSVEDKIYKFLNIFTKEDVDLILEHGSIMEHALNEINFSLKDNENYKALFKGIGDDLRLDFIKSKVNMSHCASFGKKFSNLTLFEICTDPKKSFIIFPKLHKKAFDTLHYSKKSEES